VLDFRHEQRVIEQARQQLAPKCQAQPADVRNGHAVRHDRGQPGEACSTVLVERPRVDEQPVARLNHFGELARAERRIVRPPKDDRQVVDQQRRYDPREVLGKLAARLDQDLLGAHLSA
jgi:hypothetical protein